MTCLTPFLAVVVGLAGLSAWANDNDPENGFCVENEASAPYLFVTETREGARHLSVLAPGERTCAKDTIAEDGIISVFESRDALEGCSRLIKVGTAEQFLEYAEFDRCLWGAHRR